MTTSLARSRCSTRPSGRTAEVQEVEDERVHGVGRAGAVSDFVRRRVVRNGSAVRIRVPARKGNAWCDTRCLRGA